MGTTGALFYLFNIFMFKLLLTFQFYLLQTAELSTG